MRLSIRQAGGLAPVSVTTIADSTSLSPEDAGALQAKVEEAGLLGVASPAARRAGPEQASYQIVVEHDGRKHEVAFDDVSIPDAVRSLVSWVRSVPGREERVERLGRGT